MSMIFSNLSNKLHNILKNISERGRLTSENIGNTLRQVRIALLEADVALPVIEKFIQEIKKIALNKEINKNLTPGQEFIKIVRNELINIIGSTQSELIYSKNSPTVIFLVGPQGSGKTTTIGKLGKYLKNKNSKNVLTISIDFDRPAALKQLEYLSKKAGIDFLNIQEVNNNPEILIQSAIQKAKSKHDVVLIDTAGIMHTNLKIIQKIQKLQNIFKPSETLYVIDAMMGQDAINNIKTFSNSLSLTGIILTKLDGDARGGVALSARYITKKPIKFIGTGEHIDQLEIFSPKTLVQKILGMNDIFALIKQVEYQVSKIKKQKKTFVDKKNKTFNLNDFLSHLSQIKKIGGIKTVMHQLSKTSQYADYANENINDTFFTKMEAIIKSMTIQERNNPSIIKSSRKQRIALGSGTKVQDINILLKRFYDTEKIMKQIKNKGLIKTMQKIKNLIPLRSRKN